MRILNTKSAGAVHPAFRHKNESREISQPIRTATGNFQAIAAGQTGGRNWLTAVAPTITANMENSFVGVSTYSPTVGTVYVISKIKVLTNVDCFITAQVSKSYGSSASLNPYGKVNSILQGAMLKQFHEGQFITTGGKAEFTFSELNPLIIHADERLDICYYRNSTSGVNGAVSVEGFEITDDDNYDAPYTMLVVGDSISGITNDVQQLRSTLWPFIVRDKIKAAGKNIRLVNVALSGTDANDWYLMTQIGGKLDGIKPDISFINLGMNDALVASRLSSGGTDGTFKFCYKALMRKINSLNVGAPIICNSITQSDLSTRPSIATFRTEIGDSVTQVNAENIGARTFYAHTDNSYVSTDATNYVASEQAVGNRTHPSGKGQTAMSIDILSAVTQSGF